MKQWKILSDELLNTENVLDILLNNRNITAQKEKELFLHPRLDELTIENVAIKKPQLKKALTRVTSAIEKKEQIIVFGDYDVDGITGSAILWESLREMNANALPYIPHRVDEGYGLSVKGIDNVLEKLPETKLIITVDNGIVANEAVAYAKTKGIDVIITDHHVSQGEEHALEPKAYAIVHTTKLCGAGVAFMFSRELLGKAHEKVFAEHLALAALGTIADLVPLTGGNRIIAKFGIEKLRMTHRIGLLELYKQAGIDATSLGVYEIGHMIAPRLNAAGRMEHAMDSLRLLCTHDSEKAYLFASKIGSTNTDRQFIMRESSAHAAESVRNLPELKKLLFISHETYQQGVIGLIAGRLVEEFYRPSIVVSIGTPYSKASARSIVGFDIIQFIRTGSELLVNAGGHPMAAGFTVETEKLTLLQEFLEKKAEEILTEDILIRSLSIDGQLNFGTIADGFYQTVQKLSPFGMGNFEPIFYTKDVTVSDVRVIGKDSRHLRLILRQDQHVMEAVAFGMGSRINECTQGHTIDVAYTVDENTWNGRTKLQLKIKDLRSAEK